MGEMHFNRSQFSTIHLKVQKQGGAGEGVEWVFGCILVDIQTNLPSYQPDACHADFIKRYFPSCSPSAFTWNAIQLYIQSGSTLVKLFFISSVHTRMTTRGRLVTKDRMQIYSPSPTHVPFNLATVFFIARMVRGYGGN